MNPANDVVSGEIRRLRRSAPKDRLLRVVISVLGAALVSSWFFIDLSFVHPITGQNIFRIPDSFLDDIIPHVLPRTTSSDGHSTVQWDWALISHWATERFLDVGAQGLLNTLALAVLSIILAALIAAVLAFPAARFLSLEGGFLRADRRLSPGYKLVRRMIFYGTRFLLVVLRAVPEFIWAFLFLLLFGPVMLPGIIALALHNGGILGKLASERIEDMNHNAGRALAALGANRRQATMFGVVPRVLPQFLVYFFYRFETCLREAAILGILGLETIGFYIHHEFAQFHYDDAFLFVLMNSVLVITADNLSAAIRRRVR